MQYILMRTPRIALSIGPLTKPGGCITHIRMEGRKESGRKARKYIRIDLHKTACLPATLMHTWDSFSGLAKRYCWGHSLHSYTKEMQNYYPELSCISRSRSHDPGQIKYAQGIFWPIYTLLQKKSNFPFYISFDYECMLLKTNWSLGHHYMYNKKIFGPLQYDNNHSVIHNGWPLVANHSKAFSEAVLMFDFLNSSDRCLFLIPCKSNHCILPAICIFRISTRNTQWAHTTTTCTTQHMSNSWGVQGAYWKRTLLKTEVQVLAGT